jgi:hypothetical protein
MDDRFLHDLRRAPAPGFVRRLRASLDEQDRHRPGAMLAGPSAMRWLSAAASVAVVAIVFSFPSVRAGAQSFLDLFRVVSIAAVSFDAERLNQVSFEGLDIATMLGEQPDNESEQPMPVSYASLDDASAAAGFDILQPAFVPVGWSRSELEVTGGYDFSVIARTALLEVVLEQLAIDDVNVPAALDGAPVNVRMPPVASTTFSGEGGEVRLLQARNPEMSLPGDIEPAEIAEIGLRILGLDRDEAYRLAWTIDWRSTLLLPIPSAEARFEDVTIGAGNGLMIMPIDNEGEGSMTMLLWANDRHVFAIAGNLPALQLLEMARTTQ